MSHKLRWLILSCSECGILGCVELTSNKALLTVYQNTIHLFCLYLNYLDEIIIVHFVFDYHVLLFLNTLISHLNIGNY